jgi:GalNAc-alpha-(1->4)-GalNAc-alpha-(1->3)-diNAcBac-PP-undecaprenol alpha-1,4-N-acetyl-D-galactosaminyltransferase
MNIVFTISQLSGGGAERVVSLLSGCFVEKGNTVTIITFLDKERVYPLNEKVRLEELKCSSERFIGTISQIRALRKKIKNIRPDVIISFLPVVNMITLVADLGLNSKVIVSERNDPYQNPRKKVVRVMRDFLYHLSDGFVFQTMDARDYFGKYAIERGTVIANPLTGTLPEPYKGIRKKKFVTAVRLDPQKNLEMLIDAFSRFEKLYPDYTLEIYGEGSQRSYLENKCKEMNVENKVVLKGFSKNLHENILDASAFIMSSNYEGMSNSLLEALALGVPVISTDHPIGGARMFIKNGNNGILTKVGDTDEMFNALLFAANNPEKMQAMADEAIRIRQQISVEKIVSQWMSYIEKVCG